MLRILFISRTEFRASRRQLIQAVEIQQRCHSNRSDTEMADDLDLGDFYRIEELEHTDSCKGTVKGIIPSWINGNLFRNGPGKYEVGDSKYNHLFDGLAMIRRFSIRDGEVTYQSRFLESDTYKKNMAANRIVISEFGTLAYPDPCKSAFQRFFAKFVPNSELSDNTSVNIFPISDELFAATESAFLRKVDPDTLRSPFKVKLTDYVSVLSATAHPHIDNDGTIHNIGMSAGKNGTMYSLIKIPPAVADNTGDEKPPALSTASIVAKIPVQWRFNPCYMHSFGMSDNYYVLVEQPLAVSVFKVLTSRLRGKPVVSALKWHNGCKTKFHVVDKKTGVKVNDFEYVTDDLFTFHHANTYEEDDHLIIDLSGFRDGKSIADFTVGSKMKKPKGLRPQPRRYILPLKINNKACDDTNLVTLSDTKATAKKNGKQVICTYELLAENLYLEFPMVNYGRCNGRKYQFQYGLAIDVNFITKSIAKIDCYTHEVLQWEEEKSFPSEAVFVPRPGGKDEDDGVLLSSVLSFSDDLKNTKGFLLVLDAKTMKEVGRASFDFHISRDFHGMFLPGQVNVQ